MQRSFAGTTIEVVSGDITAQPDMDAVVNAANAQLMPGGGVAGAIHRKAGPELAEECKPLAPIRPGQAVITSGHGLPNRWIIHCLGPVHGQDHPSDELLASCYRRALELAEQNELAKVAFPALSTGAFGYPMDDAAKIAMQTVAEQASGLSSVTHVRFVLFGDEAREIHERALQQHSDTD